MRIPISLAVWFRKASGSLHYRVNRSEEQQHLQLWTPPQALEPILEIRKELDTMVISGYKL